MAGLGRKVFTAGEVLSAANVQGYLQDQTVMVFAGTAARGSAIGTAVSEGMVSYLSDTNTLQFYDGATWQNVSQPGDITGVTAGTGLSGGGSSGDVTLNVDYSQVIPTNTVTAAGDLILANGSATVTNLPIGAENQVLRVVGGTVTWTDPSSGSDAFIYNAEAASFVKIDTTDYVAGAKYWITNAGNLNTTTLKLYDSSDVQVGATITPDPDFNFHIIWPSGVAYGVIENPSLDTDVEMVIRKIENTTPIESRKVFVITSTTSGLVLDTSYDAYLFGGGGGGAGISTAYVRAGSGGGGSGYYTAGTLTAGTYTATIGAGGGSGPSADGTNGGATTIGSLTANGGVGGKRPTANGVGGAGGDGGSGGGGGNATSSGIADTNTNSSGILGGNGSNGGGNGTPGTGGTGSSVVPPNPLSILNKILVDPADTGPGIGAGGRSDGGGVYAGGCGGAVSTATDTGNGATGYAGGGGGARGDDSAPTSRTGANGFSGVIILIERV